MRFSIPDLRDRAERFIKSKYGSAPTNIILFNEGISTHTYRAIGIGYDIIARCDVRRSLSRIISDLVYQEAARDLGVPVPSFPAYIEKSEEVVFTLRPTIKGIPLSSILHITEDHLATAGALLGLIHTASIDIDRPFSYQFIYNDNAARWRDIYDFGFSHPDPQMAGYAKRLARFIRGARARIPEQKMLTYSVIHGDFKPSNLLLDNGQIICVLDWDKSCIGARAFDVAITIFHLFCHKAAKGDLLKIPLFLKYYDAKSKLSTEECTYLADIMDVVASAFLLVDITYASINLKMPPGDGDPRRERYLRQYCFPVYRNYISYRQNIRKAISTFLVET